MQLQWKKVPAEAVWNQNADYRLRQSELERGTLAQDLWWSALVQPGGMTLAGFQDMLQSAFGGDAVIPADDLVEGEDESDPDFFIKIYARPYVLNALNAAGNPYGVRDLSLGITVTDDAVATAQDPEDPEPGANAITVVEEGTVTVAVIDDGIAFANDVFRKGLTETRLNAMFIQDANGPKGIGTGRKLKTKEINQLLVKHTRAGLLDEDAFYTDAGSIDYASAYFSTTMFRRSHGTHVMSLAAGYDMCEGQEKRPIIAVQLPSQVSEDTTGSNLAPSLRSAIRYILRRARRIRVGGPDGPVAPLVVNFSYGNFAGPHDGTGIIARIIDSELVSTPQMQVRALLPAANSNLGRVHAVVGFDAVPQADAVTLDLVVQPDDMTRNFVQMWMPWSATSPAPDFVTVKVTPPFGPQSMEVTATPGSRQVLCNSAGDVVAELSYAFDPMPTDRGFIELAVNPTTSNDPAIHTAPAGRWKICVEKGTLCSDEVVEVRIKRDETLPGYRNGARQAYFDNPCYVRFTKEGAPLAVDPAGSDCPVRRAGTLSGFACGTVPIVVGGLTQSNGQLAVYSSAGPISKARGAETANRAGPDATARSDDSLVMYGVLGAGARSGSMVRMNGTSVATPLVARMVAQGLACGEAADRAWVQAHAGADDSTYPPIVPAEPFVTRTGGGRLRIPDPFSTKKEADPIGETSPVG